MNNYKVPTNLDLDALRAFAKGVELGSFNSAAQQLCKSPAAISAQLKKLEQQTQCQLLRKSGRLLELTPNGELLYRIAKELLILNDQVLLQLHQNQEDGCIRFGMQEDFGEGLLQNVITQFMQLNPNVQFQVQVDRNAKLIEKVKRQELDLALIWQQPELNHQFHYLRTLPVHWLYCPIPRIEQILHHQTSVPLVVLQQLCLLRQMAIEELDKHGLAWHIAYECNSVHALWAAVRAGMGITLRSALNIPRDIQPVNISLLPSLPHMSYGVFNNVSSPSNIIKNFQQYIFENHVILNTQLK